MIKTRNLLLLLGIAALTPTLGRAGATSDPAVAARTLMNSAQFAAARAKLNEDFDRIVADTVTITEIPAPPHKEKARAEAYMAMFRAHGLSDVTIDPEGNVTGIRRGTGGRGMIAVGAHLDTVFAEGVDTHVRRKGNTLFAPGISDNSVSAAIMLGYIRALDAGRIKTRSDILFVGNVGEEELGNFRGIRYLLMQGSYKDRIKAFIGLEPGTGPGITTVGLASRRLEIAFSGPGGHSMLAFGLVNPAYAMADAIVRFARYPGPLRAHTVYNVGLIHGGTSVNAIPAKMTMAVDMRSADESELAKLEAYLRDAVAQSVVAENNVRSFKEGPVKVEYTLLGERPGGMIAETAPLVRIAAATLAQAGKTPEYRRGSSDSNIPMWLGIPGITLDSGIDYREPHSPKEAIIIDREKDVAAMATTLAAVILTANQPR